MLKFFPFIVCSGKECSDGPEVDTDSDTLCIFGIVSKANHTWFELFVFSLACAW